VSALYSSFLASLCFRFVGSEGDRLEVHRDFSVAIAFGEVHESRQEDPHDKHDESSGEKQVLLGVEGVSEKGE
jgi:hypothetical protein